MLRVFVVFSFVFGLFVTDSYAQETRSIDGSNNNLENKTWGAAGGDISTMTSVDFADGIATPKLDEAYNKPNPREISNAIFSQSSPIQDNLSLSDFTWAFGQFLDHDISLVENNPLEVLQNIIIPDNDDTFSPGSTMFMFRSMPKEGSGTSVDNPRQYSNAITAFIDASSVYGSDEFRAEWLRTTDGKLKTSSGNLLPWNTESGEFNDKIDPFAPLMADDTHTLNRYFVAGDVRANENPLLIAFHTIFVREHNRLCDEIKAEHPGWNSDRIYERARKMVGAYIQNIVYSEYLPAQGVLLPEYTGYKSNQDPSIFNVFSAAAYRLGHTLINGTIVRMDNNGEEYKNGNISLRDAFFNPYLVHFDGIEPYIKGMATQVQQDMDCKVVDDVRNFLFGAPGQGGLDLAAININRGRDRGIPDYNTVRENFGLPRMTDFSDLTEDAETVALLTELYGTIDNCDAWVGMLSETHLPDALFGQLVMTIIERQFQVLRDGDRFYFENDNSLSAEEKEEIRNTTLRDIIMRNADISLMQDNVFVAMSHDDIPNGPYVAPVELSAVIYPNPVSEFINLKLYSDKEQEVDMTLIDYMGRTIFVDHAHVYEGDNFIKLNLDESCPRGLYNMILETENAFNVLKVVKE